MKRFKGISIFIFLLVTHSFSMAQSSNHKMHLSTYDQKVRVDLSIKLDELPNQEFFFAFPEVFTVEGQEGGMGGVGSFGLQNWELSDDKGTVSGEDKNYTYTINLKTVESTKKYTLQWELKFENRSDHTLVDLASFNCLGMKDAPLFQDIPMERTWVADKDGNKKKLKDVRKTQGPNRRTMQFYPVAGGIKDLSKSGWLQQWDVNSTEKLTGNTISIVSKDGKWIVNSVVDGPIAYFFNNFESTHGCIHASPLIARNLKPGESATITGSINFIRQ